jgi:hypothetical protein
MNIIRDQHKYKKKRSHAYYHDNPIYRKIHKLKIIIIHCIIQLYTVHRTFVG